MWEQCGGGRWSTDTTQIPAQIRYKESRPPHPGQSLLHSSPGTLARREGRTNTEGTERATAGCRQGGKAGVNRVKTLLKLEEFRSQ